MAYGPVGRREVRLITAGGVLPPFLAKWEADACAPSSKRYRIFTDAGIIMLEPWYRVITHWDDARTRYVKWCHANAVEDAQAAVHRAEDHLRRLTR